MMEEDNVTELCEVLRAMLKCHVTGSEFRLMLIVGANSAVPDDLMERSDRIDESAEAARELLKQLDEEEWRG